MVCFGNRRGYLGIKEKHTTPIRSQPLFTFLASKTALDGGATATSFQINKEEI